MALGFLGTLISLERAVALRRGWALLAPAAAGAGALELVLGLPPVPGWLLLTAAPVVLLLTYAALYHRQPAPHLAVMAWRRRRADSWRRCSEPGRYPLVSHRFIDAARGAHGLVDVR